MRWLPPEYPTGDLVLDNQMLKDELLRRERCRDHWLEIVVKKCNALQAEIDAMREVS